MMALLDTHILIWWLNDSNRLSPNQQEVACLPQHCASKRPPQLDPGRRFYKLSCGYQSIRLLPCWQVRQFLRQNHRP